MPRSTSSWHICFSQQVNQCPSYYILQSLWATTGDLEWVRTRTPAELGSQSQSLQVKPLMLFLAPPTTHGMLWMDLTWRTSPAVTTPRN